MNHIPQTESLQLSLRIVKVCKLQLDSTTTEHITIKALTDVLVVGDYSIDEEFDEIELQNGASVELRFIRDGLVYYVV